MEQTKLIKNSFVSPVIENPGVDYSDDLVEVYELVDHVIPGPSGEDTDFVVVKKPVLTDSYHLNKELANRAKGSTLKEIYEQCQRSGDMTPLQVRKSVYFDTSIIPSQLGDALEQGKEAEKFLDSLSNEDKENLISLSKMNKAEFDSYISNLVKEQIESQTKVEEKGGK